ncbi:MAG: hypothetical protein KGH79_04980 [Patescibacteria group bacterium]|nr:hypothetical protein [Patescibacteria group bacterium]
MRSELTNLLPLKRQNALARDYFLRLGVIALMLLCVLVIISAVLLLPTYVYLVGSAHAKEARLANIESTLASTNDATLSARLAALTSEASILASLANTPSASGIIRAVLVVSRPGITLSGLSYTPTKNKIPGTLAVSGTATTRDALRNYQLALQNAPFAASATLPVSAYAQDANIAFTITVTLAL